MFWNMFRIEQSKLFKRRLFWIELALLALLIVSIYAILYAVRFDAGTTAESLADIDSYLTWPDSLISILSVASGNNLGGLIIVVLVGAMVAQEHTWNTISLWLSHGTPRPVLIGAKFAAMFLAVLLVALATLLVGGTISAILTIIIRGGLEPSMIDFGQLVLSVLRTAYTLLPYGGLAFFLAIATRSTLVTLGGSLTYTLFIEGIVVQLLSLFSSTVALIGQYLPNMLAQSVMTLNEAVAIGGVELQVGAEGAVLTQQLLEPGTAALIIGIYTLVFLGLSLWVFQRQDLTT